MELLLIARISQRNHKRDCGCLMTLKLSHYTVTNQGACGVLIEFLTKSIIQKEK